MIKKAKETGTRKKKDNWKNKGKKAGRNKKRKRRKNKQQIKHEIDGIQNWIFRIKLHLVLNDNRRNNTKRKRTGNKGRCNSN